MDALTVMLLLAVGLAMCGIAIVLLRERGLRRTERWVICPRDGRGAPVEFNERRERGHTLRTVRHCPLLARGESCSEACTVR